VKLLPELLLAVKCTVLPANPWQAVLQSLNVAYCAGQTRIATVQNPSQFEPQVPSPAGPAAGHSVAGAELAAVA
jgi:hypothetical protein